MRFYDIQISGKQTRRYTSYLNGANLPGALNVIIDIPVIDYATPMGDAFVQIWGVSLQDVSQASDLNGCDIQVFAGFKKGLPLANPAQSGLVLKGFVFQSFGNWIGTEQTLDLVVRAGSAPTSSTSTSTSTSVAALDVRNLSLNWPAGTKLADALAVALRTGYPDLKQNISISANLVRQNDQPGYYGTLTQLAQYVKQASKSIVRGANYAGVSIVINQGEIDVFDGSVASSSAAKQIDFKDLIGQPTWIEPPLIYLKTAMRADLKVGDDIKLPVTQITNSAAAASSLVNQKLTFQGGFKISSLRHVGNLRQPDAASWVTAINAAPLSPQ